MQAALIEVPKTREQWDAWSWHHRSSHIAIRQAILARGGPNLPEYIMWPIEFNQFSYFLQANSQSHTDMLSVLHIQSEDLLDVNMQDDNQKSAWIYLHALDHRNVEIALGITS
jgi:hypothetical protein